MRCIYCFHLLPSRHPSLMSPPVNELLPPAETCQTSLGLNCPASALGGHEGFPRLPRTAGNTSQQSQPSAAAWGLCPWVSSGCQVPGHQISSSSPPPLPQLLTPVPVTKLPLLDALDSLRPLCNLHFSPRFLCLPRGDPLHGLLHIIKMQSIK